MNKLGIVYHDAIEHTKRKVRDDIIFYVQSKEKMPSIDEYLFARNHYIEQIWINIWINRASNQVPRVEKKQYLSEKGLEVEGIERKMINKLFRTEIKTFQPFPVEEWFHETFSNPDEWAQLYKQSRADYIKRQEIQAAAEEKKQLIQEIEKEIVKLIRDQQLQFYLLIRKFVADRIVADFTAKVRYKETDPYELGELVSQGPFNPSIYLIVSDFFDELTGVVHKTFDWGRYDFEYERYGNVYLSDIYEYLSDYVPKKVKQLLSPNLIAGYEEKLVLSVVRDVIEDFIYDISEEYYRNIGKEFVSDLIKLAEIPFEAKVHEHIFIQDLQLREKRIAEEKAEIQRKKEEEARILKDIFELEYNPPAGRDVRYILHIGETNTGKTYQALQRMKSAENGMYLAPLRLLALEVFDLLNAEGTPCSLKTGEEEKIIPHANHISCTVEMFHEKDFFQVVVIDEAQMISDKDRGFSWYKAITKVQAKEVHIIASRNAREMLVQLLGNSEIEVIEYKREIPLEVEKKEFKIKNATKGDALICFSRKRVLETAARLQNAGHNVSMIYGSMPPETRKKQVERFINGETEMVVATDAIGMGLNLPIRRIVFLENRKFDGTSRRLLTSQEVKQIAGRAGRKGLYEAGKVAFIEDINMMRKRLLQEDEPIQTFTIAPTSHVFERFQKYYRDLDTFFALWSKFKNPKGTKKASLSEEKELYQLIRGTELEARLSLMDLYGLLHLPFSTREPELIRQWKKTVEAIVSGKEWPEPKIKNRTLEDLELSYKAVGLHLLFLYRLNQRTNALYWERIREEISDLVHEKLKTEVKKIKKRCRQCNRVLPWDHRYHICDSCYELRYRDYHDY